MADKVRKGWAMGQKVRKMKGISCFPRCGKYIPQFIKAKSGIFVKFDNC